MRREPSCINYGEIEISTNNVKVVTRPWSDLPAELLSLIADRLGIIELMSFRGVCKAWQAASSAASAKIEGASNPEPWFLFYGENSQCHLYNTSQRRYTMRIPELDGATCMASNQGWLLIFKEGSMFFYCPFSHAKIDLPKFPRSVLSEHASAFSSPPTSPECIVAVMHRDPEYGLELYVLYRGADTWTRRKLNSIQYNLSAFGFASYKNETFHFFDKINGLVTYSIKDKSCLRYTIVKKDNSTTRKSLPCVRMKSLFVKSDMKKKLGLGEDVSVSVCGTILQYGGIDNIIFSEDLEAAEESENCHRKGVWIQPRFFQVSSNQSWSL
ncbi:hypothetical protein SLA2020_420060 [Shorea laevis]